MQLNSRFLGNLGQLKNKFKKTFCNKKIIKLIKNFQSFPSFEGLVHTIKNVIVLRLRKGILVHKKKKKLCAK